MAYASSGYARHLINKALMANRVNNHFASKAVTNTV